jgi:hypothetical protein
MSHTIGMFAAMIALAVAVVTFRVVLLSILDGRWTLASSFVLYIGWTMSLGTAWGSVTRQPPLTADVFGNLPFRQLTGHAATLSRYAWPLIVAFSGICCLVAISRRIAIAPAGVAALLLWGIGLASNSFYGLPVFTLGLVATGAVLLGATVIAPGESAALGAAVLGISIAVASGLVLGFRPDGATGVCRQDKCGPLGVLVSGVLGNENALGLLLAMALPFVAVYFAGKTRTVLLLYLLGMTWITGSRSALLASAAVLTTFFVCRPRLTPSGRTGRAKWFAVAVAVGGLAVSVAMPLTTHDARAYSFRGYVWALARHSAEQSWVLGSGANGWDRLRTLGYISSAQGYSAHNIWLDVWFSTGVVGLAFAVLVLLRLIMDSDFWVIILPLTALLYAGALERPWTPTTANWLVWVIPALVLMRQPKSERYGYVAAGESAHDYHRPRTHADD